MASGTFPGVTVGGVRVTRALALGVIVEEVGLGSPELSLGK